MRIAHRLLPVLAVLALAGCDADDDPGGPAAEELVGTWVGPITRTDPGFEAEDTITMILGADGQFSATTASEFAFGPIGNGLWGVTGEIFTGTGLDTSGKRVNFSAPRTTTDMEGAWSAGNTENGRFHVIKQ